MDAYYDTYTSPEPVDEFLRDVNVKASIPIFRELLSPSGSEPQDVRDMATFLPICKDRSGVRVVRYPVVLQTLTSWYVTSAPASLGYPERFGEASLKK